MPSSSSDEYDDGFSVVTTKNKLRGKGRVLSMSLAPALARIFIYMGGL